MGHETLAAALEWEKAGCSVIPVRADGSKKPAVDWKRYQGERASRDQITRWFENTDYGIAVVCGAISGNLELTELEARATDGEHFDKIQDVADVNFDNWDQWVLGHRTYAELTPSGGIHLLYRVSDSVVPGNTKLANNAANECLAETRGEGGYVIVAPTGGKVHATGEDWRAINGCLPAGIKTIPFSLRNELHGVLKKALDERPEPKPYVAPAPRSVMGSGALESPGDHFGRVTSWAEILEPAGWTYHHHEGREDFWTRPGKDPKLGHSASTGYSDSGDRMYVWSSSSSLPTEEPMSKFFVYAFLNYPDMATAAAALRRQGFGADRPLPHKEESIEDWDWAMGPSEQEEHPEKPVAATESKKPNRLDVISADNFKIKRVKWLWKDRIPVGELTLVPGREGVGKSLFLAKIAADITNGTLDGEFFGSPRPIIYIASEDSWNHTLTPRMTAAGADMSKVLKLIISRDAEERSSFSLPRDIDDLTDLIKRTGAGAVMFDPILSCLDDSIDVNKAQQLRSALEPLRRSAEKSGCSMLALMHFNKTTSGDMSTKIAGSRAFAEVARAIIGLAKLPKKKSDDDDESDFMEGPSECVISQGKNNLGRLDLPNLKYHIENIMLADADDDGEASVGRLIMEGISEVSAEDALNGTAESSGGVSELTKEILNFVKVSHRRNGMAVTTQEVVQQFKDEHSPEAIRKALSRAKARDLLDSPRWAAWAPM